MSPVVVWPEGKTETAAVVKLHCYSEENCPKAAMSPVVVWPEEETETAVVKLHCYSEENCPKAVKPPVETVENLKQEVVPEM